MNNKMVTGVVILLILGGIGYFAMSSNQTPEPAMEESMEMEGENMDGMEMDGEMSMEEHMEMMNDGETVMAMAGAMNPSTLYVAPGETLRFVNHEAYANSIIADDGSFQSPMTPSGEESEFTAPEEVGTYTYRSSANENIEGTLVVEE